MTDRPDKRVYIAGPMQGYKDFNFPAFFAAEKILLKQGFEVFNPARRDEDIHGEGALKAATGELSEIKHTGFDLREALGADTAWICKYATHIYMLKGWRDSKGAFAEWALARALGLVDLYEP